MIVIRLMRDSFMASGVVLAAIMASRCTKMLMASLADRIVISLAVLVFCDSLWLLLLPSVDVGLVLNLVLQFLLVLAFYLWNVSKSGSYVGAPAILMVTVFFWHSSLLFGHFALRAKSFDYTGNVFSIGGGNVPQASAMVAFCLALTALGAVFAYKNQRLSAARDGLRSDYVATASVVGRGNFANLSSRLPLAAVTAFLIIVLTYFFVEGVERMNVPYLSLYLNHTESLFNRAYNAVQYIGVPLLFLLIASAQGRAGKAIAFGVGALLVLLGLLLGSRSVPFVYALTLVVCFDAYVRRLPLIAILLLVVLGSAGSFVIDHARHFGVGFGVLDVSRIEQPINLWHIFWNGGSVIKTLLRTMEFTAESGMMYGRTVLDAATTVVPTPILDFFGVHRELFRPSEWLVANSPDIEKGSGFGYSLVAESYLNFGYWGAVFFFPLGWFVSRNYFVAVLQGNAFAGLYAYTLVVLLALHMRNDIAAYLRVVLYGFLIIWVVQMVANRRISRQKRVAV